MEPGVPGSFHLLLCDHRQFSYVLCPSFPHPWHGDDNKTHRISTRIKWVKVHKMLRTGPVLILVCWNVPGSCWGSGQHRGKGYVFHFMEVTVRVNLGVCRDCWGSLGSCHPWEVMSEAHEEERLRRGISGQFRAQRQNPADARRSPWTGVVCDPSCPGQVGRCTSQANRDDSVAGNTTVSQQG